MKISDYTPNSKTLVKTSLAVVVGLLAYELVVRPMTQKAAVKAGATQAASRLAA